MQRQRQEKENDLNPSPNLELEGKIYGHFIDTLRSPATKTAYETSLIRYLNHLRLTKLDDLPLHTSSPRFSKSQIIDYITSLKKTV